MFIYTRVRHESELGFNHYTCPRDIDFYKINSFLKDNSGFSWRS
ncbi:MAG: hypothetical protein ACTSYS_15660 [Promethearchaeota archaeon]